MYVLIETQSGQYVARSDVSTHFCTDIDSAQKWDTVYKARGAARKLANREGYKFIAQRVWRR